MATNLTITISSLLGALRAPDELYEFLEVMQELMVPMIVAVGLIGVGLAIFIGFRLATADTDEKRTSAKKMMFYGIIGVGGLIILVFIFYLLSGILISMSENS